MRIQKALLASLLLLSACTSLGSGVRGVSIIDGGRLHFIRTAERVPSKLLVQSGMILGPDDRVLLNGNRISLDEPVSEAGPITLQVRRAVTLSLVTPAEHRTIQTSALTVGEALAEAGLSLYAADRLDPSAETSITGSLTVSYAPARELAIELSGEQIRIRSSAPRIGEALAGAGVPLLGLDYSLPAENEALPADGLVRIVRVQESLVLSQKPIAFESEFQASADVELDQQQVLQPGQPGLSMGRVRIRYEDGQEVARQTETETLVRPPQTRVVGYGTKIVPKNAVVDGVTIEYWRAVQMFATAYSPCRSAADRCYPGTSSGKPVKKGVVAVVYRWYVYMQGQPVYIPGYGHATIEDVGGGIPGRYWIDLGYSDSDYQEWGTWVTVYFLTPAPQTVLYVLD
ncbi:MAG TPA: G5 domain-containing protein [Anaerolineales bacterium]|jgi:uncharacterized protein YabE (DUF348 family)